MQEICKKYARNDMYIILVENAETFTSTYFSTLGIQYVVCCCARSATLVAYSSMGAHGMANEPINQQSTGKQSTGKQ